MRVIPVGLRGTYAMTVKPEHLASQFKDAILPPVLATPIMVLIMENAALNTIRDYLEPDGVVIFYKKILSPLIGSDLEKGLEDELKGIHCLTPGDFKVVKSKFQFKTPNQVSHRALTEALKDEARIKEVIVGKKVIGF